jgi:heme exporter protein C
MRITQRLVPLLLLVAAVMFVRAPFMIGNAPYESSMGLIQKIFYFHVPSGITALLATFVSGLASAWYLKTRNRLADHLAVAGAELVVVFGLIVLATGPLWARKAWGVWWQWEARLMMTLVMWMVFAAYLLLRRFGGPGSDVLAAAVALFGMFLAPFVYWSVNFWRTLHPKTEVIWTLPPGMGWVFLWCAVAFLLTAAALLITRVRLGQAQAALEDAQRALED